MVKSDRWIVLYRNPNQGYWQIEDPYTPFFRSRVAAEREADALIRMGYHTEVLHAI